MTQMGQSMGDMDGIAPARNEDRMLLDEAQHRAANEVAAAIAAMRLARGRKDPRNRQRMIDRAIDRLEGFGDCCRLLSAPMPQVVDAGETLERICRALLRSRLAQGPRRALLNISPAVVPGETARRLAMVAHELVTNSLKHAFRGGEGELEVRLERLGDCLVLSVIDDGPGLIPSGGAVTNGKRLGGRVVAELVGSVGGSIECDGGPGGTAIHVMIPIPSSLDVAGMARG